MALDFMGLNRAKIMHTETMHLDGMKDEKSAVTHQSYIPSPSFGFFPDLAISAPCLHPAQGKGGSAALRYHIPFEEPSF